MGASRGARASETPFRCPLSLETEEGASEDPRFLSGFVLGIRAAQTSWMMRIRPNMTQAGILIWLALNTLEKRWWVWDSPAAFYLVHRNRVCGTYVAASVRHPAIRESAQNLLSYPPEAWGALSLWDLLKHHSAEDSGSFLFHNGHQHGNRPQPWASREDLILYDFLLSESSDLFNVLCFS